MTEGMQQKKRLDPFEVLTKLGHDNQRQMLIAAYCQEMASYGAVGTLAMQLTLAEIFSDEIQDEYISRASIKERFGEIGEAIVRSAETAIVEVEKEKPTILGLDGEPISSSKESADDPAKS